MEQGEEPIVETSDDDILSQVGYEGSPYTDQSWEVVGEAPAGDDFFPMQLEVYEGVQQKMSDPMFADYGGIPEAPDGSRWHLPENIRYVDPHEKAAALEEELARYNQLTDEQLEAIKQAAFEEGRIKGMEESSEKQLSRMEEIDKRMITLLADMQSQVNDTVELVEKGTIELALRISQKIIGHAVEINPEYILQILREALKQSGSARIKKVRVSPEDMEFINVVGVRRHFEDIEGDWDFEADETIRSGCIVDTTAGEIDYQVDQAWERVKDEVVKIIK